MEQNQLTEGSIWKSLLRFAFPLFLGNIFQQMYNAVDTLVVGNFCDREALAAVSSSGSLCFLLIGFFQGLFVGASIIISRKYGAKDADGVDTAVHNTVFFSVVTGILLSVLGVLFTPQILKFMGTPENVLPNSVLYFRIYCAGLLGLVLYNMTNGIFQALGDSKHPLYYLIFSSLLNIVLDLLFVAVFHWGVAGAALATVIGQSVSAFMGFLHFMSGKFEIRISLSKIKPHWGIIKQIMILGLPTGIQNSVINIANVVVQANINAFGDTAMAGCGSYMKLESFLFIPIMSISLALTTFVSQNLGAGKPDRAKNGARFGITLTTVLSVLMGVFVVLMVPSLLKLFSSDMEVIRYGIMHSRVVTWFYVFCFFSHTTAGILRGSGNTTTPMIVFLTVWCVIRVSYITVMVNWIPDIRVVFSAYPVTWIISSIWLGYYYFKGSWLTEKSVVSLSHNMVK